MKKKIAFVVVSFVSIAVLLGGCTNKYDKEIDKVISLETAKIKNAKKDIDSVERENTCVKVFRDGDLIELEYKIRKDFTKNTFYKKLDNSYEWITSNEASLKNNETPVYKENCD